MKRRDVVIVGGGPAGACAALVLLAAGHRVRVYERQQEIVSSPCGEAIPRIALSLLEHTTGFDSSPFVRHLPEDGRLVFPDRRATVLIKDMAVLDRTAWQRAMIHAVRQAGGEVELGVGVRRILPQASEVAFSGGRRQSFDADTDEGGRDSRRHGPFPGSRFALRQTGATHDACTTLRPAVHLAQSSSESPRRRTAGPGSR